MKITRAPIPFGALFFRASTAGCQEFTIAMEWDIDKLGEFLEKKAQEGVAIERKIYEWKLAEQKVKVAHENSANESMESEPIAKAG
ncbi:hypothetical protein [Terriglobus sp. RCC_193]|uniref:hypothetical protein n=1 Tax=Terriglobus sp. RCC_193 TaxID=3239218 RepID=UPI003523C00A